MNCNKTIELVGGPKDGDMTTVQGSPNRILFPWMGNRNSLFAVYVRYDDKTYRYSAKASHETKYKSITETAS